MFRVRASDLHGHIPRSAAIVMSTLVLASILSVAAVYQVREEYRLLEVWLARSTPISAAEIRDLQRDVGTRIIIRSTSLAVLVSSTAATLWLQHRQIAIRRALNQIKLFARDILASMDEGVITTDQNGTITSVNSAALGHPRGRVRIVSVGRWHMVPAAAEPLAGLASEVADRNESLWDRDFTLDLGGRRRRSARRTHMCSKLLQGVARLPCFASAMRAIAS